jgi:hypothetical protein
VNPTGIQTFGAPGTTPQGAPAPLGAPQAAAQSPSANPMMLAQLMRDAQGGMAPPNATGSADTSPMAGLGILAKQAAAEHRKQNPTMYDPSGALNHDAAQNGGWNTTSTQAAPQGQPPQMGGIFGGLFGGAK